MVIGTAKGIHSRPRGTDSAAGDELHKLNNPAFSQRTQPMKHAQTIHRSEAFSLMEVVLTLAVLSFACIGLLGLLSAGLGNFRTAMDGVTGSQIFQRVVADLQQTEFDALLAGGVETTKDFFLLPERDFDEQGNEISPAATGSPNSQEMRRILYRVRTRISKPGAGSLADQSDSGFTSIPTGDEASRFQLRDTVFVAIQVANNPGNRELPVDDRMLWSTSAAARQSCPLVTYTAVVTRNGHR